MRQQPGDSPGGRPTPPGGLPTPINPLQRAVHVAPRPYWAIRPVDSIATIVTPRRIVISVALAVISLLLARGVEIRISEIIIQLGR